MFTRPDNSVYPSAVMSSDIDNAELAARLNAVTRLRRTGRVILADDFTDLTGWCIVSTSGTLGIYTLFDTVSPYIPPGMLVLHPNPSGTCLISKFIPVVAVSSMGIELILSPDISHGAVFADSIEIYLSVASYHIGLRWEFTNFYLQYLDNTEAWVNIIQATNYHGWHDIKLTCNLRTGKYIGLWLDRRFTDISNASPPTPLGTYDDGAFSFKVHNSSETGAGVFVDSAIVTTDEP